MAQRGSPSWLAFSSLAKFGPLRGRISLLRADLQVSNVEYGPDAIFGREAGRKLPNKLDARQDAEPVCAMDGAIFYQIDRIKTCMLIAC